MHVTYICQDLIFVKGHSSVCVWGGVSIIFIFRDYGAAQNLAREEDTWGRHSHELGYNPHCVFLSFLKNVGFDPTVLLDFLISSETCFLEYFVRYLKLLPRDWGAFSAVCKGFDGAERTEGINTCGRVASLVRDAGSNRAGSRPPGVPPEPPDQARRSPGSPAPPQAGCPPASPPAAQSLVDYDASDDSEADSPDLCPANRKQTSAHQEVTEEIRGAAGARTGELRSGPAAPKGPDPPFSPRGVVRAAGTSSRTVKCFRELHGAVSRLQKRNLFPYNPAALLRLLKRIEAVRDESARPSCNGGVLFPGNCLFRPNEVPVEETTSEGFSE